jgi:molecular chaperone GrpE
MNQEENEELSDEAEAETAALEDAAQLKQALAGEREKAETNLAGWQRAQADFINYKRRVEREMKESGQFANSALMLKLLPVLDDLERAIAAIPEEEAQMNWAEGIQAIERKLRATLEAQGLAQVKALGEPFDPHIHEAVMQAPGEEGMVVEEVQKGYQLHDRVIRPAKVVVGRGDEEKKEA